MKEHAANGGQWQYQILKKVKDGSVLNNKQHCVLMSDQTSVNEIHRKHQVKRTRFNQKTWLRK